MRKSSFIVGVKTALLFVGTVIGAGFASGRELAVFFSANAGLNFYIGVLLFVLFSLCSIMVMRCGREFRGENLSVYLFNKYYFVLDLFMFISLIITLAAMLSGVNSLFFESFNIKIGVFALITFILSAVIVSKGISGLVNINTILVPIIIIFIVFISFKNTGGNFVIDAGGSILSASYSGLLYLSMNMLLSFIVLFAVGKNLSDEEIKISGIIGGLILSVLVFLFLTAIVKTFATDVPMPIIHLSRTAGKFASLFVVIIMWLGIFTTILSSLFPLYQICGRAIGRPIYRFLTIYLLCLLIGMLGFVKIVKYLYPVMSVFGAIILLIIVFKTLFSKNE